MMSASAQARKIPDIIRERIICEADPVGNALNHAEDGNMQFLFSVWTTFIHPGKDEDITCWRCRGRIIEHFKVIKAELVELEKQHRLLKSLQP